MDIRPCPRCCKLVPRAASFCGRCGVALAAEDVLPIVPAAGPERAAGGWLTLVPAMGALAVGAVMSMCAVSGPWCHVRRQTLTLFDHRSGSKALAPPAEADAGLDRGPAARRTRSHPSGLPSLPARPSRGSRPIPLLLTLRDIAARNPPRSNGPQLLNLSARHAGAGHKVTITGRRLKRATQVLFIGHEAGPASARFVVWDDSRLLVVVPDLGERTQAATVAVRTEEGVAVMVPAGSAVVGLDSTPPQVGPVAVVPSRGAFFGGGGPRVVFVEEGGAASAHRLSALFVRRGGRLLDVGPGALVFCEDGAVVPSLAATAGPVIVPAVNPCFVDALFHYTGR